MEHTEWFISHTIHYHEASAPPTAVCFGCWCIKPRPAETETPGQVARQRARGTRSSRPAATSCHAAWRRSAAATYPRRRAACDRRGDEAVDGGKAGAPGAGP